MAFNPRFPQFDAINVSTDAPKAEPSPKSVSSTVCPKDDLHNHPRTEQQSGSTAEHNPYGQLTQLRVQNLHDSFGRVNRPSVHSHPRRAIPPKPPNPIHAHLCDGLR
jgi:hypothetical protein